MRLQAIIIAFIPVFIFISCKKKEKQTVAADEYKGYFSIVEFAKDQWDSHLGSPFTVSKIVTLNGKRDSVMLNSYNADWDEIFRIFFATDLKDPKLSGKYDVVFFNDSTSDTKVLYYTAKDKDVFTKTVQVRIDLETDRILSVYIEASKKSFWRDVSQRLYYVPMKLIQIQENEDPLMGDEKKLRIEYDMD